MTNAGDAILDPYMGVGSTIIAAIKHDRAAYGCDIVPHCEYRTAAGGAVAGGYIAHTPDGQTRLRR